MKSKKKFDFREIWGRCLIRMRDDGLFALYTASQDCKDGDIEGNSLTVYTPDYNVAFLNKNSDTIKNLIYEETTLDFELEIKPESEQEKDDTTVRKLKKYFGRYLIKK